jgi:integrase
VLTAGTFLLGFYIVLGDRRKAEREQAGVRLHDLRHGRASLLLAAGADIAVVSKILGHGVNLGHKRHVCASARGGRQGRR